MSHVGVLFPLELSFSGVACVRQGGRPERRFVVGVWPRRFQVQHRPDARVCTRVFPGQASRDRCHWWPPLTLLWARGRMPVRDVINYHKNSSVGLPQVGPTKIGLKSHWTCYFGLKWSFEIHFGVLQRSFKYELVLKILSDRHQILTLYPRKISLNCKELACLTLFYFLSLVIVLQYDPC